MPPVLYAPGRPLPSALTKVSVCRWQPTKPWLAGLACSRYGTFGLPVSDDYFPRTPKLIR